MFAVVGNQFGRHGFELAAVEHVQKQRLQNVLAVVTQRDLGRAQFGGHAVKHAAAQTRAQTAGGLAFRNQALNDGVGVFFDDAVFNADAFQVSRQHMRRKTGLLLIQIDRDDAEINRR